jgi:hypothetical protein
MIKLYIITSYDFLAYYLCYSVSPINGTPWYIGCNLFGNFTFSTSAPSVLSKNSL